MRRTFAHVFITLAALVPVVVSTSVSAGPTGGALPGVLIEVVRVTERFGIPADAEMVAANVTAVNPVDAGFVTVFPCDDDVPTTSNINYLADDVAPNLTLTRISTSGTICIATRVVTDLIIDIVGYVPAGSNISALPSPVRFLDTRDDGPTPLGAGTVTEVPIAGLNGIDAAAETVMFNLTAIAGEHTGFLAAFPCGQDVPKTSSVNYAPRQVVPNMVTSRLGADGSVCVFTKAPVEIIVDVTASATAGITTLASPVRVIDTREGDGPVAARDTLSLAISDRADVPETATAAVYNLTSVGSQAPGYATSYPCDIEAPRVSNLNYGVDDVVANGTITKLSAAGELCIFTLAQTDLIVDLVGYTEGPDDYVPLTPVRALDSREGWQRTCDWMIVQAGFGRPTPQVFNVITGRLIPISGSPSGTPTIDDECAGVMWFQGDRSPDSNGVFRQPFGGATTRTPIHASLENGIEPRLHMVGGRVMVSFDGGALTDAETGEELWAGPRPSDPITDMEVSANGIAVATWNTGDNNVFEIWDVLQSRRLFGFEEAAGTQFDLSPDGRYVVLDRQGFVVVITVFGDAIDGFDVPVFTRTHFTGDGSMFLCASFNGIFEWNLYDDIDLVMDWDTLVGRVGENPCLFLR